MPRFDEYRIRDPFVLVANGKYYMYESSATMPTSEDSLKQELCVCARVSEDMLTFSEPVPVFTPPAGFWATQDFWAPEVHEYKGAYYLFVSLKSKKDCRGTQIFRAESPMGPFVEWGTDGRGNFRPTTPADWECLDGTLYVEDGVPYMVFCHEWLQVGDGEVCALRLTDDLKSPVGEPMLLFTATQSGWPTTVNEGKTDLVTDGPFFYRMENGALCMIWSSFHVFEGRRCYGLGVAVSESGRVAGPWHHDHPLLFEEDGGHAMIFTDMGGVRRLILHQPNHGGLERARLFNVLEKDGRLTIAKAEL